jgi:hypothetical protein
VSFSDFDTRRIQNYLAGQIGQSAETHQISRATDVVLCGAAEQVSEILNRYAFRYSPNLFLHLYRMYVEQAQKIVSRVNPLAEFCVYPGDLRADRPVPVLTKSRRMSAASHCTLLPLNYQRHWGNIHSVDALDISFSQKNEKLVWRGTTTGKFMPNGTSEAYSSRAYIYASDHCNPNIDIGFSDIVQIDAGWPVLSLLKANRKPALTIAEQLQSKYLLSLEGNDVASGLKWMLYSNSVVIMPTPTCESWACEGMLVPYEHFVPVAYDLSDLNDVYEWCVAHPKECEDIARNGRKFIQSFLDPEKEARICDAVVSEYLRASRFSVDQSDLRPIALDPASVRRRAQERVANGEHAVAERILALGTEKFPDWLDEYGDPVFSKDLLKVLLNQGRFDEARSKAAVESSHSRPGWHKILFARALENTGRIEESLPYWIGFLETHPGHLEAREAVRRLSATA